ncbi:nitroreductase family deazaflavin-dependent oxidoreductase [Jiangella endophytica]|uniref:nitroreductase family deazaflavin-dependent oxidoreductase n=1 Tax=Jiangella endophytica TaxID=1623398 RepID=UPI000E350504|nr:nitroreductase family deazaflavin-dependent oxidoreductase [Jiangella endophytica]
MDDAVRRAIELTPAASTSERVIDITTTGRRTGRARRIEIFFYRVGGETYLCSGTVPSPSWYVNLVANPEFTVHLKHGVRADLAARATPVTDPAVRRAVLTEIVADLNQPSNPGHLAQPVMLEDWLGCRLVRVDFAAA